MANANYQTYRDLAIRRIEAIPVAIPMLRAIKWARGEINTIDNVIVVITLSDGTQGIADAPPRPTIYGETQASLVAIIKDHFAPMLTGVNAFDLTRTWSVFDAIAWNPTAKAALDMALYDAQANMQIGSAAAAHFACTYNAVHAHEFSSFLDAKDHLADRDLVIKDGQLIVPEGPGVGLNLDPKKLKKYRLDK